jgi:GMP synthase-like glutamine amidotransferase
VLISPIRWRWTTEHLRMARVVFIDLWPEMARPGVWKQRFSTVPVTIAAAGYQPEVIHYRRLVPSALMAEPPMAYILSGSSSNLVEDPASDPHGVNVRDFAALSEVLAGRPGVPVLGICFGFQYLTVAGGGSLRQLPMFRSAAAWPIRRVRRDALFAGLGAMQVVESHGWCVDRLAPGYRVVARSSDGIEAARHRVLPRFGVQFHPEYYRRPGATRDGRQILTNWLSELAQRAVHIARN